MEVRWLYHSQSTRHDMGTKHVTSDGVSTLLLFAAFVVVVFEARNTHVDVVMSMIGLLFLVIVK
jgi:hypothetical protein